jgi:hypothetical protein
LQEPQEIRPQIKVIANIIGMGEILLVKSKPLAEHIPVKRPVSSRPFVARYRNLCLMNAESARRRAFPE